MCASTGWLPTYVWFTRRKPFVIVAFDGMALTSNRRRSLPTGRPPVVSVPEAPLFVLGSLAAIHVSCTVPAPRLMEKQVSTRQVAEQPSPLLVFPSSHVSAPSLIPSPQTGTCVVQPG